MEMIREYDIACKIIESSTKENFLRVRKQLRSDLATVVTEIKHLKANRKTAEKVFPDSGIWYDTPHALLQSILMEKKNKARALCTCLAMLNRTPLEKMFSENSKFSLEHEALYSANHYMFSIWNQNEQE